MGHCLSIIFLCVMRLTYLMARKPHRLSKGSTFLTINSTFGIKEFKFIAIPRDLQCKLRDIFGECNIQGFYVQVIETLGLLASLIKIK